MAKFVIENDIVIKDIGSMHESEKFYSPCNPYSMKNNYHFQSSLEFYVFMVFEFNKYWSRAYNT